jgi:L-alanine-DL-glutamate epimerase-like enolase superfamily enzyme
LCKELTVDKIKINSDGMISAPETPGLGVEINIAGIQKYLVDVEIRVGGKTLFNTPLL